MAHFLIFPSLFSSQRSALPTSVGFVQVTHPFPKGASVSPRGGWGAVSVHPTFLGPSGLGELPGGFLGAPLPAAPAVGTSTHPDALTAAHSGHGLPAQRGDGQGAPRTGG